MKYMEERTMNKESKIVRFLLTTVIYLIISMVIILFFASYYYKRNVISINIGENEAELLIILV